MFHNKLFKFCGTVKTGNISKATTITYLQKRQIGFSFLLEWFNSVFNAVDRERLNLVGPDCACAEWVLRNGASVRFKGHPELLSDYNELIAMEELSGSKNLKIEEIYARGADLSVRGFDHLKNCDHVKKITLIFCTRITDSALYKLNYVQNTLQYLELTSCFNVQDKGVKSLVQLRNLTALKLSDLVSVKDLDDCVTHLRKELPNCHVEFKK